MGELGAIEAGKAFVEYVLDDSKLDSQLGKISHKLNAMTSNVALLLAGAGATAFAASAVAFGSIGDELEKMSVKTGLSVENLSELKFAAAQSSMDLDTLQKAFKNLQENGIDPAQFDEIAAEIRSIPDATARAEASIDMFGKWGQALLPLIQNLPQLRDQARALGLTMSTEDAKGAEEFHLALEAGEAQIVALSSAVGGAIAGPLTDFLKWSQGIVATIIEWIQNNPALVTGIAAATGVLFAMSAAMKGLAIAAAIAEAFTNPVALALSLVAGAGAAAYVSYATSGSSAALAPAGTAAAGTNGKLGSQDSGGAIVDRLDKLVMLARNSGTVAGVG
jgi:hypothetical protein